MSDAFDLNLVRGAVLILLMLGFFGIWAWAWSSKRKAGFDAASRLPLEEDDGTVPTEEDGNGGKTEEPWE